MVLLVRIMPAPLPTGRLEASSSDLPLLHAKPFVCQTVSRCQQYSQPTEALDDSIDGRPCVPSMNRWLRVRHKSVRLIRHVGDDGRHGVVYGE